MRLENKERWYSYNGIEKSESIELNEIEENESRT